MRSGSSVVDNVLDCQSRVTGPMPNFSCLSDETLNLCGGRMLNWSSLTNLLQMFFAVLTALES